MTTAAHPIPEAALERPIAFVGATGSGKTFAAKGAVERLLAAGRRVCIVDPTGVWFGLRSRADGQGGAFNIVIFGGEHADVPIADGSGDRLGELLASGHVPAIVDTSEFSGAEAIRFLTPFFERLYADNRSPLHLVLDEADAMAPQNPMPEGRRLLGVVDKIARRGRAKGFRLMSITQRPAVLNKNVLSQVGTLVALQLMSAQDRKAIEGWVKGAADVEQAREVLATLPRLARGEGWVWSPALDVLERVTFPPITTFDSSRTPEHGEVVQQPRSLASVDVEALRAALAVVDQEQPSGDRQAHSSRTDEAQAAAEAAAERRGYDRGVDDGRSWARLAIEGARDRLRETLALIEAECVNHAVSTGPTPVEAPLRPAPTPARTAAPESGPSGLGAERKPLAILAGAHPGGLTDSQWAIAAGFKRTGGTWGTYKSRLRTAGLIEVAGDVFRATDAGMAAIGGDVQPMPAAGAERVAYWAGKVGGAGRMLKHLAGRYPESLKRAELAGALGMAAGGGTFGTYLSRLRSNGLVEEDARRRVRAAPSLMS